ncbi:MAG: 2-oxo acid dehydrogenase subunit E2, partial [Candidatus Thorarchaeota archaeon]|nr:2-oxo acid dehydrogenase subunit E2 [Candidatus Thorarchaeota archaeon]
EMSIDLALLVGTGPNGRIVEKDVLTAQSIPQAAGSDDRKVRQVERMAPLRRTIARRMTQSAQNPHITMITEIDMTEVVELRKEINERVEKKHGIRVSFNDIIVKAVADILERFPKFNATLVGNDLIMFDEVNIGVAMATDDGLIVPAVRTANRKSVTEIAIETKDFGKRARENALKPEELTGSTFTVSNLGPFKVDLFIPVINPPETAILALGQIKKKPVVLEDKIVVRSMMMASCAVDHRILDGAPAGQFLAALKEILENPFMMKF